MGICPPIHFHGGMYDKEISRGINPMGNSPEPIFLKALKWVHMVTHVYGKIRQQHHHENTNLLSACKR